METEFKTSGLSGISGMTTDILNYLKFALLTKFGLIITMLITFIYLISLYIAGSVKTIGLVLSILAFIGFVVLSWLKWFRIDSKIDEE